MRKLKSRQTHRQSFRLATLCLFLNLPIWANFVDPTDLSPTTLDQTSSIGWTQPHPQPQPGLAKQHWLRLRLRLRPSLLDWAG